MATQVKRRRGTQAEIDNFTPALGEWVHNTTDNSIHTGDGVSQGGNKVKPLSLNITVSDMLSSKLNSIPVGGVILLDGFYSAGDGGHGTWKKTNSVDVVSELPVDRDGGSFTDALGSVWEIVPSASMWVHALSVGVVADNVTDDADLLNLLSSYCAAKKLGIILPNDGRKIVLNSVWDISALTPIDGPNCSIKAGQGLVEQPWDGIVIGGGNGRQKSFGIINGFTRGLVLESTNASRIHFKTISNCVDGLVLDAGNGSNLDNQIFGTQIGKCQNPIKFEQQQISTQQGNEIRVNFVSNCLNTLVFDDNGTHTESSNWDSNFIELMAVDPANLTGATLVYNKTPYGVPAVTFSVMTWAGGWIDETEMQLLKGGFTASHFTFNFANKINSLMFDQTKNYSSCTFNIMRGSSYSQLVSPVYNTGSKSSFNGGEELHRNKYRVRVENQSALAPGKSSVCYVYHALSAGGSVADNFTVEARFEGRVYATAIQQNNSEPGRIAINYTNISDTNIPAGETFDLTLKCGD